MSVKQLQRYSLITAVLAFASVVSGNEVHAQDSHDNARERYEEFKKSARNRYDDFRKQANSRYAEFLKMAWQRFNEAPAIPKPKDEEIPPVVRPDNEGDSEPDDFDDIVIEVIVPEEPEPQPQPVPVSPVREDDREECRTVEFPFYGTDCKIRLSENLSFSPADCGNEALSRAWSALSGEGLLNNTIRDCLILRMEHNLCDWAYLNMLEAFAKAAYGNSNEATLLMAYLYCQSGYAMRLGKCDGRLYMLFASDHTLYDSGYYDLDGVKFYSLDCKESSMEISEVAFPDERGLSLLIKEPMKLSVDLSEPRQLSSASLSANVQVNKNLMDFYNTYPTSNIDDNFMTRWATYANTPLDENLKSRLYPALKKELDGLTLLEAANRLLNWVQTSLVYEFDDKVWGCDRAFFAEETLYYPYSDCEDRSILFSHLIRDLLGLDAALVYAPGHLFTAVDFGQDVGGAYLTVDNRKFVVCEPTCTNGAPVGWSAVGKGTEGIELIVLDKIECDSDYRVELGNNQTQPRSAMDDDVSGVESTECKKSLYPVFTGGRYGYKDASGNMVVPCIYDRASDNRLGDRHMYSASKDGKLTLFDSNGKEVIREIDKYIPLDLNLINGEWPDRYGIIKADNSWTLVDFVMGPLEDDFCLDEYDMDNVAYETDIYCDENSADGKTTNKYVILRRVDSPEYGVIELMSHEIVVPFSYRKIAFDPTDRSKVIATSDSSTETAISLKHP